MTEKSKTGAEFEKEVLHSFEERAVQGRFAEPPVFPDASELDDIMVAQDVGRVLDLVPATRKREDALLVLRKG